MAVNGVLLCFGSDLVSRRIVKSDALRDCVDIYQGACRFLRQKNAEVIWTDGLRII